MTVGLPLHTLQPESSLMYSKRNPLAEVQDTMTIARLEDSILHIKEALNMQEQQCLKRYRKVISSVDTLHAKDESLIHLNEQLVTLKKLDRSSTMEEDKVKGIAKTNILGNLLDVLSRLESLEKTLLSHQDAIVSIRCVFWRITKEICVMDYREIKLPKYRRKNESSECSMTWKRNCASWIQA